ncbi:cadmium-translocating P-type ATPase [Oceanispirochaeta crateris]|uniref:P-type Zn(2+) transporter n=1 Tax=Oceanispirochaeta crateris TaxID=2518645 RepID=A0A5C1QQA3_9SPIO|nr:heavy metal translocating P-type ATPase [Oceanispirochaeta crateris]QEN09379.1 cadmium-translocating P-type ATPase [Oceanispirochaeta crateris]
MSVKIEYTLSGLCCSQCAAVIERKVKELDWVKNARVNMASQILYLDSSASIGERQLELQSLVDSIEDGIILEERGGSDSKSTDLKPGSALKKKIPELLGAALFFVLTFLRGNETLPLVYRIVLYSTSYLLIGHSVLLSGLKNMKRGRFLDENFLMILATSGAFALGEFPEAVAVMLFYQIGEFFQDMAVDKSRRSIRNLMDSKPGMVSVLRGTELVETPPDQVEPGTLYRLRAGDRIPLDGVVMKGTGSVDTSALTGESYPRRVHEGRTVLSGYVNKDSLLEIRSTKSLSESSYARIIAMVEESSSRKAQSEQFITRFARFYTPIVVGMAVLLAFIPPLVLEGASFGDWLYRALVFLVVSCPCALVISIPLGFFAGIGRASKEGILVKGGNYLEALNRIDTVFLDKTGTLTKGVFSLTSILPAPGIKEAELFRLASLAESASHHPIAISIQNAWTEQGGANLAPDSVEEIAGHGLKARYQGQTILVGKRDWLLSQGIEVEGLSSSEGTTVYVAMNGVYQGALNLSDSIRPDAEKMVKELRKIGIKSIIMLTGDANPTAEFVSNTLGLDGYESGLLPHQKVEAVERAIAAGQQTAFLGDGINDAPVLARAGVGIAMGALGSDAAIEAADVVLMADEPFRLVNALRIARKTRQIVLQNIIMALGIKAVILILAAMGYAGMGLAIFGDVGVALLAILNVLRIMSGREPTSRKEPDTSLSYT